MKTSSLETDGRSFKAGDTVYSQRGQEAEFVAQSGGSYVVHPIYEDEDGLHTGEIETWSVVFRTPPAPKLDVATAAAEQRLADIRAKVNDLKSQLNTFERGEKQRLERIKRHDDLALIDRYLAGEITHYVALHEYCPTVRIMKVGETLENYSSTSGIGLLTLYPSRNWDKQILWSVNYKVNERYTESRDARVHLCFGEADASAKAAAAMQRIVDDYLTKEPIRRPYINELFRCCAQFGVAVPQSLLDDERALKLQQAQDKLAKSREEVAKAEAEVAAVTGEIA